MNKEQRKISFQGVVRSVQARSNVWRYRLDNRTHTMRGYNVFLAGTVDGENKDYVVAISEKQQEKLHAHISDVIKGTAWTKLYPELEYADFYRAGALKKMTAAAVCDDSAASPWQQEVPALSVYDWRGCRMLDKKCWNNKCFTCKWAAMANVTIEYDWEVRQKFRFESFCYGPKNCKLYKMGRPRAVPYKGCGSCYDEGWLDEICTENRGYED